MLVVTVELWPGGALKNRKTLGVGVIANTGDGTTEVGHYVARFSTNGKAGSTPSEVRDFPRQKLGAWDLLARALAPFREEE